MKKILHRAAAMVFAALLLALAVLPAAAAPATVNIEDVFKKTKWYVAAGTEDAGLSGDKLIVKSEAAGGAMAGYFDEEYYGDCRIRMNLQLNRTPIWTAIMFRIVGDYGNAVAFYNNACDKYAVFFDGDGVMFITCWKKTSGQLVKLVEGVPGLFDDGKAHLLEIESENLSATSVRIRVYVDGTQQLEAIDDGDIDLCGGPAITKAGRIGIHAYQGAASPLGPDLVVTAAGGKTPSTPNTTAAATTTKRPEQSTQTTAAKPTESSFDTAPTDEQPSAPDASATESSTVPTATAPSTTAPANTEPSDSGSGWIVWVIVGVIVAAAAGAAAFVIVKKKKSA